jgi:hypothetical protein
VRDLLVDYLRELKPSMDYSSLEGWAYRLVRLFWWEVLQTNPGQADLHLTSETATQWRERLAVTTDGRPRREIHSTLFAVRGMYRDLAEWSPDQPARWGPPTSDMVGMSSVWKTYVRSSGIESVRPPDDLRATRWQGSCSRPATNLGDIALVAQTLHPASPLSARPRPITHPSVNQPAARRNRPAST